MGTSFVALYRGPTVATARLIATSTDPTIVADVAARLLTEAPSDLDDHVLAGLERGRRSALRLIREEAGREPSA